MTWVALKSLVARRMRAALTALAIVLGVAMVAGSFILLLGLITLGRGVLPFDTHLHALPQGSPG